MTLSISIVIPTYNEENTITETIQAVAKEVPGLAEILVVDDGSTDRTAAITESMMADIPQLHLLRQGKNQGKSAALKAGFAASTGDIVIVQDADLEYDPRDIPDLVAPIQEGKADVVYGSRFLVKRAGRVLYYRHYLANRFITGLSNLFTDCNFTDVETGYKAFRGEIIRNMILTATRFGFEIEVTAKVAKLKCRTYEVPISYHGRTFEEGKKIGTRDGIAALFYIFKYNLFTSKKKSFTRLPDIPSISRR